MSNTSDDLNAKTRTINRQNHENLGFRDWWKSFDNCIINQHSISDSFVLDALYSATLNAVSLGTYTPGVIAGCAGLAIFMDFEENEPLIKTKS